MKSSYIQILKRLIIVFLGSVIFGCASSTRRPSPKSFTSKTCSELFDHSCFNEVITLGNYLRKQGHDKFYQLSSEFAEVFTPEGPFTEYTMESYEHASLD